MPNQLSDYTSNDEIRAVLGVSDDELADTTLDLPLYLLQLEMQIEGVAVGLIAEYFDSKAAVTPTPLQQRLVTVVQVFSAYATAKTLLSSLPLFAPRRITDGRAEVERFNDPFAMVREGVESYLDSLEDMLEALAIELGLILPPVKTVRSYAGISPLATNPVTNV